MLRQWRTPSLGASSFLPILRSFVYNMSLLTLSCLLSCAVKRQPKLKIRYRQRVEVAIKYVKTIDDYDDLVDPRTLALYFLGPEPSTYFLRTIEIEEKKSKYLLSSSLSLPFLFFFFLQMFSFCKDDDEI